MKNNNFKSGKVIVKDKQYSLENVSDGEYCANGAINDLIINKGACDITVPQIDISFEDNIAVIRFTDDINLGGYYISTTNEETPSYAKISGKEYILDYTIAETARYYIYVKDSVGNINSKYFDLCPKDTIWEYAYKTEAQEFIVPANGKYKLEAWGAGTTGIISGSYYASDGRWTNLSFGIGNPYSTYDAGGAGYYGGTADTAGTSLVQNYTDSVNNITYTLIDSSTLDGINNTNGRAKITLIELSN